jgi:hypothetical protein
MAQGIYYEVDGRISGPVTFIQLQLLATSGMLQPHHRVRKEESDHWFPARQVKGLFSPAEVAAAMTGPTAPEPDPSSGLADQDTEFSFGPGSDTEESELNSAFNFFKDEPVAAELPAPPPPPAPVAAPPPKKKLRHFEPQDPVTVTPVARELIAPVNVEPKTAPTAEEFKPELAPNLGPKTDVVGQIVQPIEVGGQAVELLADETARPIDGKVLFRLTRNWLLASCRFADGTTRSVYLRPQKIDVAILEQRPAAPRTKGGPYPVLAFRGGGVEVALSFHGSDKPFRTFLEKVILLANSGRSK